jgi:hypothetical protein
LLDAHKRYWEKRTGTQNLENSLKKKGSDNLDYDDRQGRAQRIPDLELYIINVISPKEKWSHYGRRFYT